MKIRKETIVTGLDIGSSKVSAVAVLAAGEGALNILAHASQPSRGISRGAIVELGETVRSVSAVMKRLSAKISRGPGDIYVNISGESIKSSVSRGMVPLSLRGREISRPDIDRCINAASTIHIPFDREIVHRIVREFSIDDEPPIKNPLGLYGARLACEVYIVTAGASHMQNIYKCVSNAGYDVKEIVYTGIADGLSLLDDAERNEGAVILDMGSSLTHMCVFADGVLSGLDVISTGAGDIGGDFKGSPAFDAMVSRINSYLQGYIKSGKQIKKAVITGGVSFNDGIVEYLEDKLKYPIKMGVVKGICGDISGIDGMRLSTAIGLAKYACQRYEKKTLERNNPISRLSSAVVDIFNSYF